MTYDTKGREMIETYSDVQRARGIEITQGEMIALNAFRAFPVNAFTAEQVARIMGAVSSGDFVYNIDTVKKGLTLLARRGLLRSRVDQGERLYEINFAD